MFFFKHQIWLINNSKTTRGERNNLFGYPLLMSNNELFILIYFNLQKLKIISKSQILSSSSLYIYKDQLKRNF